MKSHASPFSRACITAQPTRGSVLISALIFALIIAISLTSYLSLSTGTLKHSNRTFYADAASNLAEVGLEEAVWSFNTMGNSTDATVVANAWTGWTISNSIADTYMTSMGTGYTSAPTVTFSGGGGSGAAGTATLATVERLVGGVIKKFTGVSSVTITNPGTGYTSTPTITLTGGGGTGATAVARLAATRTFTFADLGQNASGTVKVWVAGYNGTAVVPIVVAKATVTLVEGPPIEKTVKVILSKNGLLPKGVVAKEAIKWNGHPFADSYVSSDAPGKPPFVLYDFDEARANTTVASLTGPEIELGQGTVNGNVMTGPGVTVTGGTISGEQIGNFSYNFAMPAFPTGGYSLGTSVPATLPRAGATPDVPAADGKYYYRVNNTVIGATTITAGADVVIVGSTTRMEAGLMVQQSATMVGGVMTYAVGKATIYMDGPIILSGNDAVNTTSWAGALEIYTTTSATCSFSGNAKFYGCLFAPNAPLDGNGGGHDEIDLCGSFVVRSVTSNGHMSFHYDEGLNTLTHGKPWTLALWKELQTAPERALYAARFDF